MNDQECEEQKIFRNNRERIENKKDTKENNFSEVETTKIVPNELNGIENDQSSHRCDNKNEGIPIKINKKLELLSNKEVDNMPAKSTAESTINNVPNKNDVENTVAKNLIEEDKSETKVNSKKAEVIKTCTGSLKYFKHLKPLVDAEYDLFFEFIYYVE